MTGDRQKKTPSAPSGPQKETTSQRPGLRGDVLADLRRNVVDLENVLTARYDLISAARAEGIEWRRIGEALGMSTQGAHRWFTNTPTRRNPYPSTRKVGR